MILSSLFHAAPSLADDITRLVDRYYSDMFARYERRLSAMQVNGDFRRFVVARMGSTGSTWLAKLLNSHPEVFCSHEGILDRIYPSNSYGGDDIVDFIEMLGWDTKHNAYHAVGDVGSVWTLHLPFTPFQTAVLLRHPARVLRTRLDVFPKDQAFTALNAETQFFLRRLWKIDLASQSPIDQIFLQDLWVYSLQLWALGKAALTIRIEDMQSTEECARALNALTGLDFDTDLIDWFKRQRVNHRSNGELSVSSILSSFSPRQRQWYKAILRETIDRFGYSLASD